MEVNILPFLQKPKVSTGVTVHTRNPDENTESSQEDASEIDYCAEDLIKAVHAKDINATAEALKSAFTILDSMPHEEGEHTNEEQS